MISPVVKIVPVFDLVDVEGFSPALLQVCVNPGRSVRIGKIDGLVHIGYREPVCITIIGEQIVSRRFSLSDLTVECPDLFSLGIRS